MSETAERDVDALIAEFADTLEQADLHFGFGADNPVDEARLLVLGMLGWDASTADAADVDRLNVALQRRINERIPVPYLTGKALFAGLEFNIEPGVMIPRSPIAELIETRFAPWLAREPHRILDLCTGSGCIGIACALAFEHATVTLADWAIATRLAMPSPPGCCGHHHIEVTPATPWSSPIHRPAIWSWKRSAAQLS